jgi:hypothetical protein
MLRDTFEDVAAGYFNVSREYLDSHGLDPCDVESDRYREWVASRVELARRCFETGKRYLALVPSLRCRLAGYAYTARFVQVLNSIERENFALRPGYTHGKFSHRALSTSWSLLSAAVMSLHRGAT